MPYRKGQSGNPKGKPPGALNKTSLSVKEALIEAFDKMGGVPALIAWGQREENQAEFYKLWAKIMPTQHELSGPNGQPLQIYTGVPPQDKPDDA